MTRRFSDLRNPRPDPTLGEGLIFWLGIVFLVLMVVGCGYMLAGRWP
jgi:hypothetical protein